MKPATMVFGLLDPGLEAFSPKATHSSICRNWALCPSWPLERVEMVTQSGSLLP